MSLSKNINPRLVLVQPGKTRPFITEILLVGHKESNKKKLTELTRVVYAKNNQWICIDVDAVSLM